MGVAGLPGAAAELSFQTSVHALTGLAMPFRLRLLLLVVALAVTGCAERPRFAQVTESLGPVPPGQARIYFYRANEIYESVAEAAVALNGRPAGVTAVGSVFYRDVPPGSYYVTVASPGLFPNQFKTIDVAAGQTWFVKIESLRSWADGLDFGTDTFVVAIMDATVGRSEIQRLAYVKG
jgi:hypothetical protein